MKKLLKTQIYLITHKAGFIASFVIMMFFVITNYVLNVKECFGVELADIMGFLDISTMSGDARIAWLVTDSLPFLVVMPAGFSLAADKAVREDILWISRCGRKKYMISKTIAVFITTFICFTLPLLIELGLNVVTFPMEARGNMMGCALYSYEYSSVKDYYMFPLYYKYPVVYALVTTTFLGTVSGMLSVVTMAVSAYFNKYKAYLLLPVYLILNLISLVSSVVKNFPYETYYGFYFNWCIGEVHIKDFIWFGSVIGTGFIAAVFAIAISARKDTL